MTDDGLFLARRSLEAAALLARRGFDAEAVSRAYYAAFYAARAAARASGANPSTHRGVAVAFSQHMVQTGRIAPELSKTLRRLMARREDADYDEGAVDPAGALEAIRGAEEFVNAVATSLGGSEPERPAWASFTDDQKRDLVAQLTREMDAAAENLEFETRQVGAAKAAELRDSIAQIEAEMAA